MAKRKSTKSASKKDWKTKFLEKLRTSGNVGLSVKAAGVERSWPYKWRKAHPDFADAWEQAMQDATDVLEAEARRRSDECESDVLLMFLLKAHRPEKFRDNMKHEHSGGIVFRLEYADDFAPPATPEPVGDPEGGPAV